MSTAPNVGGHLAAQAAVVIGANTTVNDIYAGAAVTTGAGSKVNQIKAGAAAGIGANATAGDVNAGAAVVVGAVANVGDIIAGAAITLGANATAYSTNDTVVTYGAGSTDNATGNDYIDQGFIKGPAEMTAAMMAITNKFHANPVDVNKVETYTGLSGLTIGVEGGETTEYYSAINLQANTTLTIEGNVTVITSGAITLGAGAEILLGNGANVTWILGGALNLGAGSKFRGETYVNGAVNGATSDVVCGNLYATGAISIGSIGTPCVSPIDEPSCPIWTASELQAMKGKHIRLEDLYGSENGDTRKGLITGEKLRNRDDDDHGKNLFRVDGRVYADYEGYLFFNDPHASPEPILRSSNNNSMPWSKNKISLADNHLCFDILTVEINRRLQQ
ncbi:hypothetical protein [Psychromonas ingrahamii]|uniref:hypothetical protein n=1 Tax=Psychromonas ingrahamii TaxID=357794 RepID=UPI0018DE98ED|nr:hypothetical protein [Psychromonas ingrahamii]